MYAFKVFDDLLLSDSVFEDFIVFLPNSSYYKVLVKFAIARRISYVHTTTEIDHDYHALNWQFFLVAWSLGAPIFNKILFDAVLVFLATINAFLRSQEYSTKLTVYHLDVGIDSIGFFLVEILYCELEIVGYATLYFFE